MLPSHGVFLSDQPAPGPELAAAAWAASRGLAARAGDGGRRTSLDDDPAHGHRRRPRQLGCPYRHDHPRGVRARHAPRSRVRDPAEPRRRSRRRSPARLPRSDQRAVFVRSRAAGSLPACARPRRDRAQVRRLAAPRRARRLLRAREPARLRGPRRCARRGHDRRQGAAERLGDPSGVGRSRSRGSTSIPAARTTSTAGRRSRTCGRARRRTTTRAWRGNAAS